MNATHLLKHICLKLLFDFMLCLLSFPPKGGRMLVLSSKYNIEQANFTDWIFFQPSNLIEEISPHPKALSRNTWRLESTWNTWKDKKKIFKYEYFKIASWILACNINSCKETSLLSHAIRKLRKNWEVSWCLPPINDILGEFFPKKGFPLGKIFGTNLWKQI